MGTGAYSTVTALLILGSVTLGIAQENSPLRGHDSVNMVTIPAGSFIMGNPAGVGRVDEQPEKDVHVSAFAIDEVEVTNESYLVFTRMTGHKEPHNPYGDGPLSAVTEIDQLPVVQVSWHDAVDYCRWVEKRLPTEAEWEKAARGTDKRIFPWGDEDPTKEHAINFDRTWKGKETLWPVGTSPRNRSPYGVLDMAGNVREWTQDWYDPQFYQNGPTLNPVGADEGIVKSVRGGSWGSFIHDIRVTARGKGGFALKTDGVGIRCAKNQSEESNPQLMLHSSRP